MVEIKAFVGLKCYYFTLTDKQFKILVDYGKLETFEEFTVYTILGFPITTAMIDSYSIINMYD